MRQELTEQQFLNNISKHKMIILHNEGIRRHLRFKQPGTINMSFDIITWPGYLCYTGDMGTFVFSRLTDMFCFFRNEYHRKRNHLPINPGYWSEKVEASDRCDGITCYSPDKFREAIRWQLKNEKTSKDKWEAIQDEVLRHADDGEYVARNMANDFEWEGKQIFPDFWETDCSVYTNGFIWCCYALVWGIQQYDQITTQPDWNC